jgi:hypothetical protein
MSGHTCCRVGSWAQWRKIAELFATITTLDIRASGMQLSTTAFTAPWQRANLASGGNERWYSIVARSARALTVLAYPRGSSDRAHQGQSIEREADMDRYKR